MVIEATWFKKNLRKCLYFMWYKDDKFIKFSYSHHGKHATRFHITALWIRFDFGYYQRYSN